MTPQEFQVASAILEDHRKLIAAGKSQRWDVIKWSVTVNVALATALLALVKEHPYAGKWLFGLAVVVAVIAFLLILHYNNRLRNIRNDANVTSQYMSDNGINLHAITGKELTTATWLYDKQELVFFTVILFASTLPVLIIWLAGS
jgi:uncharacterized membrane protein